MTKSKTKKRVSAVRITEVRFGRIKNLGNFENERLEVAASVGHGQNPSDVLDVIERFVEERLGIRRARPSVAIDEVE